MPGIGFRSDAENVPEWDEEQMMTFEKESLGFYLTSHPLQPYRREMLRLGLATLEEVAEMSRGQVKIGVLVTGLKEFTTRKGDKMAFLNVEDLTGHAEVTVFPKSYAPISGYLQGERPLVEITGTLEAGDSPAQGEDEDGEGSAPKDIKITCDSLRPLSEACESSGQPIVLAYPSSSVTDADLQEFKAILTKHRGGTTVHVCIEVQGKICVLELGPQWKVLPSPQFHRDFDSWTRAKEK